MTLRNTAAYHDRVNVLALGFFGLVLIVMFAAPVAIIVVFARTGRRGGPEQTTRDGRA